MNAVSFTQSFDACVGHVVHAKYQIYWKGPKGTELVDEFDNEQTAKAAVRDYEMAYKAKPGDVFIKKA